MTTIFPKKSLGQHFLKDLNIAKKIADTIQQEHSSVDCIIEVGPGMGVLTQYLIKKNIPIIAVEIDTDAVNFLQSHFQDDNLTILQHNFLKLDMTPITPNFSRIGIIGNFPYNISSQIVFKTIELRDKVVVFSGMFQKEVAERICANHGNKIYGVISVLVQAYFDTAYLFDVSETVFFPSPKVKSGVIRLRRKTNYKLDCDENLFKTVVKTSFNHRRKTLRNSLASLQISKNLKRTPIFDLRPEQLDVRQFISLTKAIQNDNS